MVRASGEKPGPKSGRIEITESSVRSRKKICQDTRGALRFASVCADDESTAARETDTAAMLLAVLKRYRPSIVGRVKI